MKDNKLFIWLVSLALAVGLFGVLPAPRALAATYYSQGNLAPNLTSSWNSNRAGGGSTPINFTSGDTFVIQSGHSMTTTALWTVAGTGATIQVEGGGVLTADHIISVPTFQIDNGGMYIHNAVSGSTNGSASDVPGTTRIFGVSSTVEIQKWANGGTSPVALPNVTWGNLTINVATLGGSWNQLGNLNVSGNLTIVDTGGTARELRFVANSPATPTITIGGNLNVSGGILNLTNGTATPTVNIGGNFNQTGGTFTSSGTGIPTVVFTGGSSPSVTFSTSGGTFTNTNINWQIANGKTVALNTNFGGGSWVNSNRSMTVNGAFQINQGAWPGNGGVWSYNSTTGALIFNNSSGSYGVGNDNYWPTTNGPVNVTVQGAGGITMNVARTVGGIFQTSAGVTNGNNLALNGTTQINTGGFFIGSPTYGPDSTLVYNPGGSFNIASEWINGSAVGSGVPKNVTVQNNTDVVLPTGAGTRTVPGNFTLTSGSLTLGGSIGDDLVVKGNWTNNGGILNASNRAVTFDGATSQSIGGISGTTFDFLIIDNPAGVSLSNDQTVNGTLTLANGRLTLGSNNLTLGPSAPGVAGGPFGASKMIVADGSGKVCKQFTAIGSYDFPIGDNSSGADYSPAQLDFTSGSFSSAQACVNVNNAKHPNMPGSDYLTRYWTVTQSGISNFSCDVTFNYVDTDITGNEADLTGAKWDGIWTVLNPVDQTYNRFSANVSSFSDFSAGKEGPLAVTLADFHAAQQGDAVLVTWETTSELNNRGFNLFRGTSPAGWERQLNTALIPSQSQGSPSGFVYTWLDEADLVPGTTYYYWLQDVDLSGATSLHGPVSVDFTTPTAVTLSGLQASPDLGTQRYSTQAAGAAALPTLWIVAGAGAALALGRRRRG